jgi:hypothetical protein
MPREVPVANSPELRNSQAKLRQTQQQLAQAVANRDEALQRLQQVPEGNTSERNQFRAEMQEAQRELALLKQTLNSARSERNTALQEGSRLWELLKQKQPQLDQLRQQVQEKAAADVRRAVEERAALEAQLNATKQALANALAIRQQSNSNSNVYKRQVAQLQQEVEQLKRARIVNQQAAASVALANASVKNQLVAAEVNNQLQAVVGSVPLSPETTAALTKNTADQAISAAKVATASAQMHQEAAAQAESSANALQRRVQNAPNANTAAQLQAAAAQLNGKAAQHQALAEQQQAAASEAIQAATNAQRAANSGSLNEKRNAIEAAKNAADTARAIAGAANAALASELPPIVIEENPQSTLNSNTSNDYGSPTADYEQYSNIVSEHNNTGARHDIIEAETQGEAIASAYVANEHKEYANAPRNGANVTPAMLPGGGLVGPASLLVSSAKDANARANNVVPVQQRAEAAVAANRMALLTNLPAAVAAAPNQVVVAASNAQKKLQLEADKKAIESTQFATEVIRNGGNILNARASSSQLSPFTPQIANNRNQNRNRSNTPQQTLNNISQSTGETPSATPQYGAFASSLRKIPARKTGYLGVNANNLDFANEYNRMSTANSPNRDAQMNAFLQTRTAQAKRLLNKVSAKTTGKTYGFKTFATVTADIEGLRERYLRILAKGAEAQATMQEAGASSGAQATVADHVAQAENKAQQAMNQLQQGNTQGANVLLKSAETHQSAANEVVQANPSVRAVNIANQSRALAEIVPNSVVTETLLQNAEEAEEAARGPREVSTTTFETLKNRLEQNARQAGVPSSILTKLLAATKDKTRLTKSKIGQEWVREMNQAITANQRDKVRQMMVSDKGKKFKKVVWKDDGTPFASLRNEPGLSYLQQFRNF